MAIVLWGEEEILNRCFKLDKITVSFADRSPRKEFEADKLQLLRGLTFILCACEPFLSLMIFRQPIVCGYFSELLDYYLDHNRFCAKDKTRLKLGMNQVLARFVQDLRKPYKGLARRNLLSVLNWGSDMPAIQMYQIFCANLGHGAVLVSAWKFWCLLVISHNKTLLFFIKYHMILRTIKFQSFNAQHTLCMMNGLRHEKVIKRISCCIAYNYEMI